MGAFAGIGDASVGGVSKYFVEGDYVLSVKELSTHQSRDPQKRGAVYFIIEAEVLAVNGPDAESKFQVGSTGHRHINLSNGEPALGEVKAFVLAMDPDMAEEDVTEEFCEMLVSEDQPAKGAVVRASFVNYTTRNGTPFTRCAWSAYEEDDE